VLTGKISQRGSRRGCSIRCGWKPDMYGL